MSSLVDSIISALILCIIGTGQLVETDRIRIYFLKKKNVVYLSSKRWYDSNFFLLIIGTFSLSGIMAFGYLFYKQFTFEYFVIFIYGVYAYAVANSVLVARLSLRADKKKWDNILLVTMNLLPFIAFLLTVYLIVSK